MDMRAFIIFLITWIAENLSIPFWVVGHVHLTLNMYEDIYEVGTSLGMNIIVALGFWLRWREHRSSLPK
jgi:hypothetical protein